MKTKPSLDKIVAQAFRAPKPRRVREKSALQLEYEKMLSDYKVNGAAHLASARAKMGAK